MIGVRGDRGSSTLELVVLAPALLAFFGLLAMAGRVVVAKNAVNDAAWEGARAASISRTAAAARSNADTSVRAFLSSSGLHCTTTSVTVDTAGFAVPVGTPAQVSVTVTCDVDLSGITLPVVPGSRVLTATGDSPLDTYRERG